MLLKLLETSRESRTLAVGASDLGNFISAHPHGRSIVTGEAHAAAQPPLTSSSRHALLGDVSAPVTVCRMCETGERQSIGPGTSEDMLWLTQWS